MLKHTAPCGWGLWDLTFQSGQNSRDFVQRHLPEGLSWWSTAARSGSVCQSSSRAGELQELEDVGV